MSRPDAARSGYDFTSPSYSALEIQIHAAFCRSLIERDRTTRQGAKARNFGIAYGSRR